MTTKKKLGKISAGIMLRHMDKPKAQKPETLTSLQIELTEHLSEFETCSYCGEDKATEEYMIKGGSANWIELDFCPKCIGKLRTAQPPICDYEICPLQELTKEARAEGMAQGKKEILEGFGFKQGRYKCDGGCSNEKGGSQLNGWHYYDEYGYCWCLDCVKPEAPSRRELNENRWKSLLQKPEAPKQSEGTKP